MYKTLSRNMQARRDSGLTDFPESRKTISVKEERRREKERQAGRLEQEKRRFLDPANRSRLGGWPIERFDALGASFQMICACGYMSSQEKAGPFSRRWAAATDAIQLIRLRHAACCPDCARKSGLTNCIILYRDIVEFGAATRRPEPAPATKSRHPVSRAKSGNSRKPDQGFGVSLRAKCSSSSSR
jgi:hypothetical protein